MNCLLAGLRLGAPLAVWAKRPYPPYKEAYTVRAGRIYRTDVHVWAYTAGFAERFQMPRRWVEPRLEGVLGLAYRIEFDTARKCGFDEAPHCRAQVKCVLDAYFPREAGVHFRNDLRVNHDPLGDDRSTRYLSPQRRGDYETLQQARRSTGAHTWRYRQRTKDWLGRKVWGPLVAAGGGSLSTWEYDRRLNGLDMISVHFGCNYAKHTENDRLRRGPSEIFLTKRPTENETFLYAMRDMRGTQDFDALDEFTAHVVGLPGDYLRRVAAKRNAPLEGKSIGE